MTLLDQGSIMRSWWVLSGLISVLAAMCAFIAVGVFTLIRTPRGDLMARYRPCQTALYKLGEVYAEDRPDYQGAILWQELGTVYAFSPDKKLVAIGGMNDPRIRVWDLVNGREVIAFDGHPEGVSAICFVPGQHTLLTASYDRTMKLWSLTNGKEVRTFAGHDGYVSCAAISPDGAYVLSGSGDKTLRLWDLATGTILWSKDDHHDPLVAVAYAPDGRTFLSADEQGKILLWTAGGQPPGLLAKHEKAITCLAFSPDSATAMTGWEDCRVRSYDVAESREAGIAAEHGNWVRAVAFSGDGQRAASAGDDGVIRIWRLSDNTVEERLDLSRGSDSPVALCFSASNRALFVGTTAGVVVRFDRQR